MVHLRCNLFQAVPATVTAVAMNQHVILLLEHVIIAIIAIITIAIIACSSKSITCWFMATAVTVAGTAWNKF